MAQEEKQLLLKVLCGGLPYGLKYNFGGNDGCDYTMDRVSLIAVDDAFPIEEIKPYLRPMSSMTEEEREYIKHRWCYNDWGIDGPSSLWREKIDVEDAEGIVDYFNEHHLDFRGLIPMGLALEAPEGMYKTE